MNQTPWALLVDRLANSRGRDVGLAPGGTHQLENGVLIRFQDDRLEYRRANQWLWIAPGTIEYLDGHPFSAVITSGETPVPGPRSTYRLPGSGEAQCVLAVQTGKFRGCFFAVELSPVWLGRGASVSWEPGAGGRFYPGESSAESPRLLKDGHSIDVGGVLYQYLALRATQ
jgi:hypothetical protein